MTTIKRGKCAVSSGAPCAPRGGEEFSQRPALMKKQVQFKDMCLVLHLGTYHLPDTQRGGGTPGTAKVTLSLNEDCAPVLRELDVKDGHGDRRCTLDTKDPGLTARELKVLSKMLADAAEVLDVIELRDNDFRRPIEGIGEG